MNRLVNIGEAINREGQDFDNSTDDNVIMRVGPLPIRTRLDNPIYESHEQDADEHRSTQSPSTAVVSNITTYPPA